MRPEDNRLDLMRMVIALDGKASAFNYLLADQAGRRVFAEEEILEQFLVLHEGCHELCVFLIDSYDTAPDFLKTRAKKDDLAATAAHLQAELETLKKCFAENREFIVPVDRPSTFRNLIGLALLAVLGEEQYCFFMAESNDAFAVVREHPKCVDFFENKH
jgi:hypothetical protein